MQALGKTPWDHLYAGSQLAVAVLAGFFAGFLLDRRWNSSPWMLLLGSFLGLAVGLYQFLREFLNGEH